MHIGTFRKFASELMSKAIDFSDRLASAETLTLISCATINVASDEDSTAEMIATTPAGPADSGKRITFWLQAGAAGSRHELVVKVSTSLGQKLEDRAIILVEK
jgi:hypothetical protein